jgi:DNA-directed RNA polymerase III subunit RPC8
MFLITTLVDTIRVPPQMLALPTLTALQCEIDLKYPNRVVMDVGLVISRYGPVAKQITNGSCVPGDGGSHHECLFQLIVFRPFVDEVCLGKIVKSTPEGIQVTLGFFQDIFIPAYWMLRPSKYEEKSGLWVWTPNYDEEEEEKEDKDDSDKGVAKDETDCPKEDPTIDVGANGGSGATDRATTSVKLENNKDPDQQLPLQLPEKAKKSKGDNKNDDDEGEENRFEMEIGSEIRFKVKSIHFTQVTSTAKGIQATTITTAHSLLFPPTTSTSSSSGQSKNHNGGVDGLPDHVDSSNLDKPIRVRTRSTSVDLSEVQHMPASMHIIASICEDGLGLTSWWTSTDEEEDEEGEGDEEEEEGDGEEDEDGYDDQRGGYEEEIY